MVEGFAELDGLEVRGFFVESRFAEGVEKSLDEEKGGGLVRAGRLAHAPEVDAAALQPVIEKYRIGLFKNRDSGKEPLNQPKGSESPAFPPGA
jgi:hypothetical protein